MNCNVRPLSVGGAYAINICHPDPYPPLLICSCLYINCKAGILLTCLAPHNSTTGSPLPNLPPSLPISHPLFHKTHEKVIYMSDD